MGRKSRVDGSPDRSDRPEISSFRSSRSVDSGNGSGTGSDTNGGPSSISFPDGGAAGDLVCPASRGVVTDFRGPICEIVGELDTELLAEACRTASREFESGHMRLIEVDGEPCQFVDAEHGALASILDLRHHADPVATAHSMMVQDYSAPLDVLNDHLVTAIVFQVGDDHFLWYQRAHHIALDGFAAVTMLHPMTELYNAWVKGEEPPSCAAQDLGVIVEQDLAYRGSGHVDNDRRYWLEHLEGAPPAVSLAGRVGKPTIHPALVSTELPDATASLMDSVALEHGQSVAPTIVAAFAAYLARMTGSDEVMLSLPVSGRHCAVYAPFRGMVATWSRCGCGSRAAASAN